MLGQAAVRLTRSRSATRGLPPRCGFRTGQPGRRNRPRSPGRRRARAARDAGHDAIDAETLEKQCRWFREAADAGIVLDAARRGKLQKKRPCFVIELLRQRSAA